MEPTLAAAATEHLSTRLRPLIEGARWSELGPQLGAHPSPDGVAFVVWAPPPPEGGVESV